MGLIIIVQNFKNPTTNVYFFGHKCFLNKIYKENISQQEVLLVHSHFLCPTPQKIAPYTSLAMLILKVYQYPLSS